MVNDQKDNKIKCNSIKKNNKKVTNNQMYFNKKGVKNANLINYNKKLFVTR